jgi:hypothetical protein
MGILDPEQPPGSPPGAGNLDRERHDKFTLQREAELCDRLGKADFFAGTDEAVSEVVEEVGLTAGPALASIAGLGSGAQDQPLAGATNKVGHEQNQAEKDLAPGGNPNPVNAAASLSPASEPLVEPAENSLVPAARADQSDHLPLGGEFDLADGLGNPNGLTPTVGEVVRASGHSPTSPGAADDTDNGAPDNFPLDNFLFSPQFEIRDGLRKAHGLVRDNASVTQVVDQAEVLAAHVLRAAEALAHLPPAEAADNPNNKGNDNLSAQGEMPQGTQNGHDPPRAKSGVDQADLLAEHVLRAAEKLSRAGTDQSLTGPSSPHLQEPWAGEPRLTPLRKSNPPRAPICAEPITEPARLAASGSDRGTRRPKGVLVGLAVVTSAAIALVIAGVIPVPIDGIVPISIDRLLAQLPASFEWLRKDHGSEAVAVGEVAGAPPPQLVVTQPEGGRTGEGLVLGLSVSNPPPGGSLLISGVPTRTHLSKGEPIRVGEWLLPAAEPTEVTVLAPEGFVGTMGLVIELLAPGDRILLRRSVVLSWSGVATTEPAPAVASGPAVAPAQTTGTVAVAEAPTEPRLSASDGTTGTRPEPVVARAASPAVITEAAPVAIALPEQLTEPAEPTADTAIAKASPQASPASEVGSVTPPLQAALTAAPKPNAEEQRIADLGVSRPADPDARPIPAGDLDAVPIDAAVPKAPEGPNAEKSAKEEEKPLKVSPASGAAPGKGEAAGAGVKVATADAPAPEIPGFAPRKLDADEIAMLLNRGMQFLAAGDTAPARLMLQRAAEGGDPGAALLLATTYDVGPHGPVEDVALARAWYEKAKSLGSTEASNRLRALASH